MESSMVFIEIEILLPKVKCFSDFYTATWALISSMSNAGKVPPKRGRGRPHKHPLPVLAPDQFSAPASDLVRSQRQRPLSF